MCPFRLPVLKVFVVFVATQSVCQKLTRTAQPTGKTRLTAHWRILPTGRASRAARRQAQETIRLQDFAYHNTRGVRINRFLCFFSSLSAALRFQCGLEYGWNPIQPYALKWFMAPQSSDKLFLAFALIMSNPLNPSAEEPPDCVKSTVSTKIAGNGASGNRAPCAAGAGRETL